MRDAVKKPSWPHHDWGQVIFGRREQSQRHLEESQAKRKRNRLDTARAVLKRRENSGAAGITYRDGRTDI